MKRAHVAENKDKAANSNSSDSDSNRSTSNNDNNNDNNQQHYLCSYIFMATRTTNLLIDSFPFSALYCLFTTKEVRKYNQIPQFGVGACVCVCMRVLNNTVCEGVCDRMCILNKRMQIIIMSSQHFSAVFQQKS